MTKQSDENKFEKIYFQAIEDELSQSKKSYFSGVVNILLRCLPKKKLLCVDIGCGSGAHFSELADQKEIWLEGVDAPNDYTQIAIERGYREIKNVNDFNFSKLPYDDNSVDCILCKDVLEHLYNPLFLIQECERVLKVNGTFLFHVPNHFSLYGRLKFLFLNKLDTFNYFGNDNRFSYPHLRFYEYKDFLENLTSTRLVLLKDLSYLFPALPLSGRFGLARYLGQKLAKIYPSNFGASITILGLKK